MQVNRFLTTYERTRQLLGIQDTYINATDDFQQASMDRPHLSWIPILERIMRIDGVGVFSITVDMSPITPAPTSGSITLRLSRRAASQMRKNVTQLVSAGWRLTQTFPVVEDEILEAWEIGFNAASPSAFSDSMRGLADDLAAIFHGDDTPKEEVESA